MRWIMKCVCTYTVCEEAIILSHHHLLLYIGAAMIIQPGGGANILGVIFTVPPENTFDVNLKGVVMAGGQVGR